MKKAVEQEQAAEGTIQPQVPVEYGQRTSRRGILKGAFGVAAALAGAGALLESQTGIAKADDGMIGIYGVSGDGTGVLGEGTTNGVHGRSSSTTGNGVWGEHTSGGDGVLGTSTTGIGVHGRSASSNAVVGESDGGYAVFGISTGNSAIGGLSYNGRGGVFSGTLAAVKLIPAKSAAPPVSGDAGDLFVDSASGLWYCRGDTDWVKLA